jgi:hypothetical protein
MTANLIDRYVAEIGKHLGRKNRADIQKELRSTLQDMLDDRARKAGREPDEAMILDMLKEYGNPEDVAASYLPERGLIGPQMYPIFSLVVSIVLPILAVILMITMSIGLFTSHPTPVEALKTIGSILLQVVGAMVSAFGSIVITFAILERVFGMKEIKIKGEVLTHVPGMKFKIEKEEEPWDPRDLPEVQDVEKFSIPGLVAEIAFTVVALIVFNFFPQIIGLGFLLNDKWNFLPVLSDAFFRYLPYINALWALQITLNLILLNRGRWETTTRWLRFTLTGLGIALAAVMLAGPDLITSVGESLAAVGPDFSAGAAKVLTWMPRIAVKLALLLSIVTGGIDLLKSLFREITGKSRS